MEYIETVTIRCPACKGNEEGLKRINIDQYDPAVHVLAGDDTPQAAHTAPDPSKAGTPQDSPAGSQEAGGKNGKGRKAGTPK